jgi:hypothetical protein
VKTRDGGGEKYKREKRKRRKRNGLSVIKNGRALQKAALPEKEKK